VAISKKPIHFGMRGAESEGVQFAEKRIEPPSSLFGVVIGTANDDGGHRQALLGETRLVCAGTKVLAPPVCCLWRNRAYSILPVTSLNLDGEDKSSDVKRHS